MKKTNLIGDRANLQISQRNEELNEFQTLIENTKVAILQKQERQIYYANPVSQLLTGYTKEELPVKTNFLTQLKLGETKPTMNNSDRATIPDRQIKLLTKNGKQCWLDCSIRQIQFARKPAILASAVDITKYKEAEQKSEQLLESQKKMVSMVAHELRSPLNVINLTSNLLNRYGDRWKLAEIKEYLERLQRGVGTLSLLIDEWLILGQADTGKLEFQPKLLNLEQFCGNLLSDLQLGNAPTEQPSARHQQQINFYCRGDCSSVRVDRRILQLILTNLLENALKYSPDESQVDFTVDCNPTQVTFTVKDRGIGIEKSDLLRLFEPFYRGGNVEQISGHGLGLAVVNKLVEIHRGQIAIDSEVGVGTEFKITIPQLSTN